MNKQQAVHFVARHVAGLLLAGSLEEATGITEPDQDRMSAADVGRLSDAVDEVARRLSKMGTATGEDDE